MNFADFLEVVRASVGWLSSYWQWLWALIEPAVAISTMGFTGWAAYAAANAARATADGVAAGQKAADAAIEANRINHDAVVLDHRAWIKIKEIRCISDLIWDSNGGNIELLFVLENTGKSPAKNIFVRAVVSANVDMDPGKKYTLLSQEEIARPPFRNSTLFPGGISTQRGRIPLSYQEIEAWKTMTRDVFNEEHVAFSLLLIVCVTYTIMIDGSRRQTGVIREFSRLSLEAKDKAQSRAFAPWIGNVPKEDLGFSFGMFSDDMAT